MERDLDVEERSRWVSAQIREAFAETEYPGDASIAAEMEANGSTPKPQYRGVYKKFAGRRWNEMDLDGCDVSDIYFLGPAAQIYYLPTFILAALAYPERYDGALLDYMTPPAGAEAHFARTFGSLTDRQIAAIKEALSVLLARDPGMEEIDERTRSLADFWLRGGWRQYGIGTGHFLPMALPAPADP